MISPVRTFGYLTVHTPIFILNSLTRLLNARLKPPYDKKKLIDNLSKKLKNIELNLSNCQILTSVKIDTQAELNKLTEYLNSFNDYYLATSPVKTIETHLLKIKEFNSGYLPYLLLAVCHRFNIPYSSNTTLAQMLYNTQLFQQLDKGFQIKLVKKYNINMVDWSTFHINQYCLFENINVLPDEVYKKFNSSFLLDQVDLNKSFEPRLSIDFYTKEQLQKLYEIHTRRKHPAQSIEYLYSQLQLLSKKNNFYPGLSVFEYQRNGEDIIYCTPLDIKSNCLSYGNSKEQKVITWHGIFDCWEKQNRIYNVFTDSTATDLEKQQLISLAQEFFPEKYTQIISIYQQQLASNKVIEDFIKDYQVLGNNRQLLVQRFFTQLYHLSLYMRGWNGKDGQEPDQLVVSNVNEVFVATTDKLNLFNSWITNINITHDWVNGQPFASQLLNLPLILMRDQPTINQEPEEGKTIGVRLEIMRQGDKAKGISSCIRLTSNHLAACCYYYLVKLKIKPPFCWHKWQRIG